MHLPEFVLVVITVVIGVAADRAVVASSYRTARVLTWIAALLFWSLGVVWSMTSEGYSLQTRMLVSAALGAIAAAALTWALSEIRGKETQETPVAAVPASGPVLEATEDGKIDASGAKFSGDLNFRFGKATTRGFIDMSGIEVTSNKDGSKTITPGHSNRQFPKPAGEFKWLTNTELSQKARTVAAELRQFQTEFDAAYQASKGAGTEKAIAEQYAIRFDDRFAAVNLELASEILSRYGATIEDSEMSVEAKMGASLVYNKAFAGPAAAMAPAAFLELLADKLTAKKG